MIAIEAKLSIGDTIAKEAKLSIGDMIVWSVCIIEQGRIGG